MSEDEQDKISKWDTPSKKDMFGREPFVDTIVKTIQSSQEGFNLGVSARWGEGKSSILEQLQPKLEELNYKVLTFSPWKYTQDNISIKRKFIIDIYSQLGEDYDDTELYSSTESQKELKIDAYDSIFFNRLGIFIRYGLTVSILFLAVLFIIKYWFGFTINITQTFSTNLFIPILAALLPIVTKITEVTVKHTTPKIESAEQFEKRFNDVINGIMGTHKSPGKIIIFVDDLDRCNHVEVEQILTALFTFFNNKHCTYVITADHTVIRRYISSFLKLENDLKDDGTVDMKKTEETRQKEATEYLKKIFQINFIVPRIPSDLLEPWISDLLKASPVIEFKNHYAKDYLVNLILNNFQGNPRKIKHFIRTLAFQLEAINEKIQCLADQKVDESKNLNKVKDSPELLAKILILQDRFPNFYEKIVLEPKLLQRREAGEMDEDKELQNLLAQEPKFFNSLTRNSTLKTIDPYYFLYFSGSTGFVETAVVDPAEVKALARSADFDGLTKIIRGLTDEPRNMQVEHIKLEFDSPQIQPPEKVNIVRSLFHTVTLIEEPSLRLQKLKEILDNKTKYKLEFASLQSVDFGNFITFADIDVINKLFVGTPFTDIAMQTQILSAFISKQDEIKNVDVLKKFIQVIATGISKNDANSQSYLILAKKISDKNFLDADTLQNSLIETYKKAPDPLKQELFDTLLDIKPKLSAPKQQEFEEIILAVIEKDPIAESLAMIGNIPVKINKSKLSMSKVTSVVNKRISSSTDVEIAQLANIMLHQAIKDELGPDNTELTLITLVELLDSKDQPTIALIRGRLPEFITHSTNKSKLLDQVLKSVETGPLTESAQTMDTLKSMDDFWNTNPFLKKELVSKLKASLKWIVDKDIKSLVTKSLGELDPPPEPKKKKESTEPAPDK